MTEQTDSANEITLDDLERQKAPNFQTFYTNLANVTGTLYDIAITFSEVMDARVIQDKCRIVMHPLHAAKLIRALEAGLRNRQALLGELNDSSTAPEPQP